MVKQGFGELAGAKEALKIAMSICRPLPGESCRVEDCLGRVLSSDVKAGIDVPHFNKSAMDGYAVVASDIFGASNTDPISLKLVEKIDAGKVPKKALTKGLCSEIATGAPMPVGADAVVMVEYTEADKGIVKVYKSIAPGQNVNKVGSDIRKGSVVLNKGILIKPRHSGVMTALGLQEIKVKTRIKVAIISTGDEIIEPGEKLEPGRIYDINSRTIIDAVKEYGAIPVFLGIARDDKADYKEKILKGVGEADIILLSGSSSLGAEDIMTDVLADIGKIHVHGIAVKPGKPTVIAEVKDKLVIGLPGYPTSALSNFYIIVRPVFDSMLGVKRKGGFVHVKLSRKVASTIGRHEFLAVKLDKGLAVPVQRGSSAITTLSEADGFIEIPNNVEVLEKGEQVEVRLF
ncbi:MAG: molybdopterin molybdenumtransferase MoeA [Nanoarchaeota archaeon]|nr:molybdopterin molybdenumtransferase MoeA [Nanoarchaeota archaeon]